MATKKKVSGSSVQSEYVGDDSYTSHLSSSLNKLREQGTFCNVTILVGGQRFQAHRAVLSTTSDYFMTMFTSGFQESKSSEVTIQGSEESFAPLLEFAYTGYFTLSVTNAFGVFSMACYMGFSHAITVCAKYLCKNKQFISLENSLEILSLTDGQAELSELAKVFRLRIVENFAQFAKTECFYHTSKEVLVTCLTAEEIEILSTEEEILQNTVNWLNHDWNRRKMNTIDLLKKIRLGLVPADRLKEILGDEILSIPECNEMVDEILKLHATKDSAPLPLNQSHPDVFATRNTITAQIFLQESSYNKPTHQPMFYYRTSSDRVELKHFAEVPDTLSHSCRGHGGHSCRGHGYSRLVVRNNFYIAGGCPDYKGAFYKYDSETNKWIVLPSMLSKYYYPELVELDDYIYAISSCYSGDYYYLYEDDNVERYSLSSNEWEKVDPLKCKLRGVTAVSVNGCILVKGTAKQRAKRYMMYNPTTGKWTSVSEEDQEVWPKSGRNNRYLHTPDANYKPPQLFTFDKLILGER